MERGEVRQEKRTTQPEQPSHEFLAEAGKAVADELGLSLEGMLENKWLSITEEEVGSKFATAGTNNWLRTLWYRETPAAIALETRDERNNVVTQMIYFGPTQTEEI